MRHTIALALFALFALLSSLLARGAGADSTRHGLLCQPGRTHASKVDYTTWGIGNASTTSHADVFCPAADSLFIRHWDAYEPNDGSGSGEWSYVDSWAFESVDVLTVDNSTTQPFHCQLFITDPDAGSWWGPRRYTASTSTGSPDSTAEYRGYARLRLYYPWTSWTGDNLLGVFCSLPPAGPDASWVKSIEASED